jgi:hypothetical protein
VRIAADRFPLDDVVDVMHHLEEGKVEGRAVLVPAMPSAKSAEKAEKEVARATASN